MKFLNEIKTKYEYIMTKCAPIISDHFTKLTSVINEGNSYQFPSKELHQAILHKLILQDHDFKKFFEHIKESHATERKDIS